AQNQELISDEIAKHLEAGKQVTKLALNLDDHLSFVLGEDLIVRKLKFLEGAVDQLESTERDDLRAELDARFALMAGEARRLSLAVVGAEKLSSREACAAPGPPGTPGPRGRVGPCLRRPAPWWPASRETWDATRASGRGRAPAAPPRTACAISARAG